MERFKLKAKAFRKMDDPVDKGSKHQKYVCYVQAKSIPSELEDWMATNPREQKMTTNVAQKIKSSLNENSNFHELNRGILMSTERADWNNQTGELYLGFSDSSVHGNIDGGHTLRAIFEAQAQGVLSEDRYVFFEIFTGLESPVELAAARNTSVQVDLKSIEELNRSFETLKDVLGELSFSERIAYKMNEHYNNSDIVPIDVREVIAILSMFNQAIYPLKTREGTLSDTQPIQCYNSKETTLRKFLNLGKDRDKIVKDMGSITQDIFKLWDTIENNFAAVANRTGKRYGTRKYSRFDDNSIVDYALFSRTGLQYSIPKGIMYPIVGAFRALVVLDPLTQQYSWRRSPFEAWESIGSKLVTTILEEKTDNPEIMAKNPNLWSNLLKEVYIWGYSI